jgi:hypothetical protein
MAISELTKKRLARAMNDPTAGSEAVAAVDAASATAGTAEAGRAMVLDSDKRIAGVAGIGLAQGDPTAITGGANTQLTMDIIKAGIVTIEPTADRVATVPTGTTAAAAVDVGNSIDWCFINLASGATSAAVTQATSHTVVGNMVLNQNEQGLFRTRVTTTNTAITYRLA